MDNVVILKGIPDNNLATVLLNRGALSDLQIYAGGTNDLHNIINKGEVAFREITLGGYQPSITSIDPLSLVVNTISDADSSKQVLKQALDIVTAINVPVLNHPQQVLNTTRDNNYRQFNGMEGIHIPKTIRTRPQTLSDIERLISDGLIRIPFIFREAGTHDGVKTVLLEKIDQLHELEQFPFNGRDYYITEFVDYRSNDGYYRKTRLFVIDGVVYPRHHITATYWNIHGRNRHDLMDQQKQYVEEEVNFLTTPLDPQIEEICQRVYDTLRLDFFGIDCNINEQDELLIFEINASMKPFIFSKTIAAHHGLTFKSISEAINRMIKSRLGHV